MRNRLTAKTRSAADQTPYPGNVNQPDRKDPDMDHYDTFKHTINHELPDMRHDWQEDAHDDIGFGVPTVASARMAANKAVRIAVLLLGEKVSDAVIEKQACDLMAMGNQAMDRTLARFAESVSLYADDEEKKEEAPAKVEEEKKAEDTPALEEKKEEAPAKVEEEKKAEDTPALEEKKEEACKASDEDDEDDEDDNKKLISSIVASITAALPAFIQKKIDEKNKKSSDETEEKKEVEEKKEAALPAFIQKKIDEKNKKSSDELVKPEDQKEASAKNAEDETEEKVEEKKEAKKAGMNDLDIELQSGMDDELPADAEADERLASCFDDSIVTAGNSTKKVEASTKKAGITKLGGQPRVVTASAAIEDISGIWGSVPDTSALFN